MKQLKKKNIKTVKKFKESIERALWDAKAIQINTEKQFTLASGKLSPIYIDCRKLISFPNVMDQIAARAKEIIEKNIGNVDVLAGGETAGIPFAAWIAAKLGMKMVYVRKGAKEYGTGKQIEGELENGDKVLLVEDLITDGGSKISFIEGVRNSGGRINDCLVVFDREQGGAQKLSELKVKLWSLTNLSRTLEFGLRNKYITQKEFDTVKQYIANN
ncbi:TPA: orotate phosphoribosyltransferase [archaeon]|uniref:Orotate phosphoribosyltransferase n=1 Tax=Candidatus Naiadarchaeum limnaeum TaxID=2756139 RepID=A0A832XI02_9ARCH|nr:orotate phosphoribosyltransferase [Candidatus Naiadarchaeum limnaeum]